jgi:hypothetical protein
MLENEAATAPYVFLLLFRGLSFLFNVFFFFLFQSGEMWDV